jgi:hypothetical protein
MNTRALKPVSFLAFADERKGPVRYLRNLPRRRGGKKAWNEFQGN